MAKVSILTLDCLKSNTEIEIPTAKVNKSEPVRTKLWKVVSKSWGFLLNPLSSVSLIKPNMVLYAYIPGIMVIQAGIVKTIGGVWTLCAKTIPNKPMRTVPESVEVINPNSKPSYKQNPVSYTHLDVYKRQLL